MVVPFFVLNDALDPVRLRSRVRECAEAGVDGIILHARAGLRTPYLSEAWFDAIRICIEEAESVRLKCWLYDEFPYPSGAAGGKVLAQHPQFAERHLVISRFPVIGGDKVNMRVGEEPVLRAFLTSSLLDEPLDVTAHIGVRNSTWISSAWDSRNYYEPAHSNLYSCSRATELLGEQVLEMTVPLGYSELIVFCTVTGGDFIEPFGHYIDVSNPDATDAFLEATHAAYQTRFGALFGGQVLGIFTDEPKYRNSLPWSETIREAWSEYGRDSRALLSLLPESREVSLRRSYREAIHDLFAMNWVGRVANWCRQSGLKLIGHISPEENWWTESRLAGSILLHLREFSIPGCDLIIPAAGDDAHPILNLTPTLAVSAAAQSGAEYALCEVFGCSDYGLDLQTVKRIGDWLTVRGINVFVLHGCFYSIAGLRRLDAPPTFLPPSTLHPFLVDWTNHVRDSAEFLGPNGVKVDIAIIRPIHYLFGLGDNDKPMADLCFSEVLETVRILLSKGIAFHWVDDRDIFTSSVQEGQVLIGHSRYQKLIYFKKMVSDKAEAALKRLQSQGVIIVDEAVACTWDGSIVCEKGDVQVATAADGRSFAVNLSPEYSLFSLNGTKYELEGYESRWIDTWGCDAEAEVPAQLDVSSALISHAAWIINPLSPNVFRLGQWLCNGEPREPGPIYDLIMHKRGMHSTVFGDIPRDSRLKTAFHLEYETTFVWSGVAPAGGLFLRIEDEAILGTHEAFLNNMPLPGGLHCDSNGMGGTDYPIGHLLTQGKNRLRIEVDVLDAREGMLVAPVVVGEFRVVGSDQCFEPLQCQELYGCDWASAGFPHYSGTMVFEQAFFVPEYGVATKMSLVFNRPPAGAVEVELNGVHVGRLLWSPWRLNLSEFLSAGENTLRLRVTNTLANFMNGEARPSGPLAGAEIRISCESFPLAEAIMENAR